MNQILFKNFHVSKVPSPRPLNIPRKVSPLIRPDGVPSRGFLQTPQTQIQSARIFGGSLDLVSLLSNYGYGVHNRG